MSYKERINDITRKIRPELIDFQADREHGRMPTQVSSEFLTNKEQGDWAETTLFSAINNYSSNIVAVRYGKSDNINAGDPEFKDFFEEYQNELDIIGKRPDLLLFKKEDFLLETRDISDLSLEELDAIVPKAICGIEVRSSSYLIDKYEEETQRQINDSETKVKDIQNVIREQYQDLLERKSPELYRIIDGINEYNMNVVNFRCPSWHSTEDLEHLTTYMRELKDSMKMVSKRNYLSITPKVEDLKLVYTWIQRYNVPHYYVQVFFDKAYGISFEKILSLVSDEEKEGIDYYLEKDVKNQGKTTIKINARKESNVLDKIELPEHYSEMKELDKGRLLFYVKFKESVSRINKDGFEELFGVSLD